jgi:hypothetical protein
MNFFDRTVNDIIEAAARILIFLFRILFFIKCYGWIIFVIVSLLIVFAPDLFFSMLEFFSRLV